jgi:hypothetical protein
MEGASRTSFWIEDATREGATILAELEGRSMAAVIRDALRDRIVDAGRTLARERPANVEPPAARKTGARTPDEVAV